ncbi:MAG: hypothetical protein J2P24_04020 [Streptosporangiales bacterium]|nr:hypothetical protein [Streptosporangiales bacterium]
MQQPPSTSAIRVHLPQGIRTWNRVLVGVCAGVYLLCAVIQDALWLGSLGPRTTLLLALLLVTNLAELFVLLSMLDTVIRVAYLDGTVIVERRVFGVRRCDLALAPDVRLERKAFGIVRLSAYDSARGRWMRVRLRPSKAPTAGWHPLLALADAVLAAPSRPEPAGQEAWLVAQQLRQLASHQLARAA